MNGNDASLLEMTSPLIIIKNVNVNLEIWIINLEKLQVKAEQCNKRNNVELLGILNEIPDQDHKMQSRFVEIVTI